MDLLRLAGLRRRPDHAGLGAGRDRAPTTTELARLATPSRRPPGSTAIEVLRRRRQLRQPDDAAHRRGPGRLRRLRRRRRESVPDVRRLHRRQRAEPQPLLAAAVRPSTAATPPRPRTSAARPHLRRAQGRLDRDIDVIGGALAPRGSDRPEDRSATRTRPRRSSRDLGAAYRASGRTTPIMDALAIHPYEDNSSVPPSFAAPEHDDDRARRLRQARRAARRGVRRHRAARIDACRSSTTSSASSRRSRAAKASLYTGTEPATTKPVDEATQAAYYREALALAFCQPKVDGVLRLPRRRRAEPRRPGSRASTTRDGTAKASLATVRSAMRDVAAA